MTVSTPKPLKREFRISGFDLITKSKQPLNSIAVAHLFYGVPFNMNSVRTEPMSDDLIFYEEKHL